MDAIKIEEAYHEETLNRAHSIVDLPTRTVIDCTRLLVEGLQVNKAKAKALVMDARQVRGTVPFVLLCYFFWFISQCIIEQHTFGRFIFT